MARRLHRTCDFQCGILAFIVLASAAVGGDLRLVRGQVPGPILRCQDSSSALFLVRTRLVLYPVCAARGFAVPLQHGGLGGRN